jgi:hypothetical protein
MFILRPSSIIQFTLFPFVQNLTKHDRIRYVLT